ncbi:IS30 family transposase [Dyadobacter luteus]|uniref:IS30 family transposase n=1 Tax=Dyadobacter luteus TaxID=2259619 RepID=A0A3D8Y301_9BACT|nr:IS30 family transposase [Dyadobacter luteus]REA56144.1 IS30 family transposase [Dyadobacter luteus]
MKLYRQLTLQQRYQIACLLQQKTSQKDIAAFVGVNPSTISRELRRNSSVSCDYQANSAHVMSGLRNKREPYKIKGRLKEHIIDALRERHSPEQISGALALQQSKVSHEAIYQYIYFKETTDHESLIQYLRIRHKKKYSKRGSTQRRGVIPNRVGIEHRPEVVETNTEIGHWEGDTIIGANHDGILLTLVERVTKVVVIEKLSSKNSKKLTNRLIYRMKRCNIPVKTITFDNGKEFSAHQKMAKFLEAQIYFATPYHSWERGLNENTNGLIRQYIPKSCPISIVKKSDVDWIENQLNSRPRKTLGYLSPIQFALKYKIALQI